MIRINLLPYRAARSKENIRKQVSIFLLSFVLLIIVLVVYNSHLSSKSEGLANNRDHLKKEVAIYGAKSKQVEDIKKKLDTLNKQIEIVNQLKDYRENPPKLLAKMTEMVISGRMQLTRLFSDAASLTLEGVALDNETVAVFMLRLERSGLFSSVVLASSQQVNKYNVNMKQFNINCKKVALPATAPASK
ncbi:MAG: PilN domain-containing protein [Desulfobacteraceae bacterium]|jgi:type IV pilus assembly protein PilN|nr:PilN domain-containing protein [Desulfobacteraceae bacterium]